MKKTLVLLIAHVVMFNIYGQIQVGHWREHLPYASVKCIAASEDKIYCSTELGLFSYDKTEGSIEKINTITGLSDIEISAINYNNSTETLVVGYSNGNIDLLKNREILNVSDIKRKQIIGSKAINHIFPMDNVAYLSCGFGIVLLDTENGNITDTYLIGENATYLNINEITYNSEVNFLFAATDMGVYSADYSNPNLIDFQNWTHDTLIPNNSQKFESITSYQGKIYTCYSGNIYNTDTVYVYDGTGWNYFDSTINNVNTLLTIDEYLIVVRRYSVDFMNSSGDLLHRIYDYGFASVSPNYIVLEPNVAWIADKNFGLVRTPNYTDYTNYFPNGPANNTAFDMVSCEDNLWAVAGGKEETGVNLYNQATCYSFIRNEWNSYSNTNVPEIGHLRDYVLVAVHPFNPKRVFVHSWGQGISEFLDGQFIITHNDTNTNGALQNIQGYAQSLYVRIGGMAFDNDANLWATNVGVTNSIIVLKQDGEWTSLNYPVISNSDRITEIIETQSKNKWVLLPRAGIFVFNDNNTIDDVSDDTYKKFDVADEDGNIISNEVYSIAEDHDGVIWVGTNEGIVAYYNPQNVFSGEYFYAQRIIVEMEEGNAQYLLGKEIVTSIAIDGANRKWFGTNNGVFLMSENVDQEIYAFTSSNSPLFSDKISTIAINSKSGEVFFGTEKGIISFRSDANQGNQIMSQLYVFPNPVKHDYNGFVTITGLVKETNVKITDITGNLVWETESNGGEAVWDGKNFNGQKPQTGVYLVLCTNSDGSQTAITKFLIVN